MVGEALKAFDQMLQLQVYEVLGNELLLWYLKVRVRAEDPEVNGLRDIKVGLSHVLH